MPVETTNPRPTVAETARIMAADMDRKLLFQSTETAPVDRFVRAVSGRPEVLVRRGSENDRLPDKLVEDQPATHKWASDRMAPRLGPVMRVLQSHSRDKDPEERKSRREFADFNKKAKRKEIIVDVYNRHGKVEPRNPRP